MGRVIHFEIHVDDIERAKSFTARYSAGRFRTGLLSQARLTGAQ